MTWEELENKALGAAFEANDYQELSFREQELIVSALGEVREHIMLDREEVTA